MTPGYFTQGNANGILFATHCVGKGTSDVRYHSRSVLTPNIRTRGRNEERTHIRFRQAYCSHVKTLPTKQGLYAWTCGCDPAHWKERYIVPHLFAPRLSDKSTFIG